MPERLAIHGGQPVRAQLLPYGRQCLEDDDIAAVVEVLRGEWLTTGPKVEAFENACACVAGVDHAVAVSSGTAALHAAACGLPVEPGDEVIIAAMTFAASANCVLYQGAVPVFADVEPDTLLIDPASVEALLSERTKAIVAVDYAGQPADYGALMALAERYDLAVVADACHAIGGSLHGQPVGSLATVSAFSFHPVKNITTGEGGMITTNDADLARRMRVFRNHGITSDHRQRAASGAFYYEMTELGYNYRITDMQCALGLSQLTKLPRFVRQRQELAAYYTSVLADVPGVEPLAVRRDTTHAYHLYVVKLDLERLKANRAEIYAALRAEGIGVNVHYIPVHLHPYYRQRFGTGPGLCPVAEAAFERMLTLPMFPRMTHADVDDVVAALRKVLSFYLL